MFLSNTMPELTETELRHKGSHTIEYYDERLQCIVAASYQNVTAYIERNGLPDNKDYVTNVVRSLGRYGYFSDYSNTGHYVRIYK